MSSTSCLGYFYWASPLLFQLPTPSYSCGSSQPPLTPPQIPKQQLAPSTLKHSFPRESLYQRDTKVCHMVGHNFPTSVHSLGGSKQTSSQPIPRPGPAGSIPNGDHTETPRVRGWCPNVASECPVCAKVLEVLGGTFEVEELDRPAMSKPASVGHWCPLVANRKKVTHT